MAVTAFVPLSPGSPTPCLNRLIYWLSIRKNATEVLQLVAWSSTETIINTPWSAACSKSVLAVICLSVFLVRKTTIANHACVLLLRMPHCVWYEDDISVIHWNRLFSSHHIRAKKTVIRMFVLFNDAPKAHWFSYHRLLDMKCMVIVTYISLEETHCCHIGYPFW